MWVRWARLSIVHKIDGLFLKSLALLALLAPQKVWHLPKMWDDRQKVPKVPLTTPVPYSTENNSSCACSHSIKLTNNKKERKELNVEPLGSLELDDEVFVTSQHVQVGTGL